jgi:hypothetical protein
VHRIRLKIALVLQILHLKRIRKLHFKILMQALKIVNGISARTKFINKISEVIVHTARIGGKLNTAKKEEKNRCDASIVIANMSILIANIHHASSNRYEACRGAKEHRGGTAW